MVLTVSEVESSSGWSVECSVQVYVAKQRVRTPQTALTAPNSRAGGSNTSEYLCARCVKPCLDCFVPGAYRGTGCELFFFSSFMRIFNVIAGLTGKAQLSGARRGPVSVSQTEPNTDTSWTTVD
jgi:hypothetical protein